MSYSIKRASLITDQLERLATQNAHQLAGQFSNLDFWIAEGVDAIRVINEYPQRFRRLREAQVAWVKWLSAFIMSRSITCAHQKSR